MKNEVNKQEHDKGEVFYAPWRMKKETKKNRVPPREWNMNWISCNTKKEKGFAPPSEWRQKK